MKLNKLKTQIAQANAQISTAELCKAVGITGQAYRRAINTGSRPATVGKIAAALGVPVESIIELEEA